MTDHRHSAVVAVVDDDPGILDSLESLLESANYGVRRFVSAAALLESGALSEIDVLISDLAMPDMDGRALARVVQAARPELPVILVTGRPDLLHQPPFDARDLYRVFKKPFDGEALLEAVALMLRSSGPRAPRV
jgi:FixJ family two-component response regulator